MGKYLQYGCGFNGPEEWFNYDASPMILLRKIPVIGKIIQTKRNLFVSKNIQYGNIVSGFQRHNNSCDGVFCSHILEHLTYDEFIIAIDNTYSLLKEEGIFRLVMPDLRILCEDYIRKARSQNAAIEFMEGSGLGLKRRRKFIDRIMKVFGNSGHNWLWDYEAVEKILKEAGFKGIRPCKYHDCEDKMFELVENEERFYNALAMEARK
jgi:predicted SAM-dependent methyltransferase